MVSGAPAFILGIIPTDNKFTAITVQRRWSYIKKEFSKLGITVISYAIFKMLS